MSTLAGRRVRLSGKLEVALPTERAFILFTPTGERSWADGWDPIFPGEGSDETEPGTVFLTSHGGRDSIWTVVHTQPGCSIGYVVVTPQARSGLVTVACDAAGPDRTRVTVAYDLTALSEQANAELERFAANFQTFLHHWERSIAQALGSSDPDPEPAAH